MLNKDLSRYLDVYWLTTTQKIRLQNLLEDYKSLLIKSIRFWCYWNIPICRFSIRFISTILKKYG